MSRLPLKHLRTGAWLLLMACTASDHTSARTNAYDTGDTILPDTATVAGVLELRHAADALDRAVEWQVDPVPLVVIDGGDRLDLTHVRTPVLLPDGRSVVLNAVGGGQLMLFDRTGAPVRLLARSGQGPGELVRPGEPVLLGGDTMLVTDGANRTINWYTSDDGLVRSERMREGFDPSCWAQSGILPDRRSVRMYACMGGGAPESTERRPPTWVALTAPGFAAIDSIVSMPGYEMVQVETRFRGRVQVYPMPLRFGLRPVLSNWGDAVVTGNGEAGYTLDRYDTTGVLRSRVLFERPRRTVTSAMRDALIEMELSRINGPQSEGYVDIDEARRLAREEPFADSLPPYQVLLSGPDATLWAVDPIAPTDSQWTATVLRHDGAILARVRGRGNGLPVRVLGDRVMLREVDDDGIVRFPIYRVSSRPGGGS
jgi:hypothetical protein